MSDMKQRVIDAYNEMTKLPKVDIDNEVRILIKSARIRGIHNQIAEYLMESVGDDAILKTSMKCSIDRAMQEPLGYIQLGLMSPVLKHEE